MDSSNNALSDSRILPYPADAIFAKYSNAEALARWWWPRGNTNAFSLFDFVQWGKWVFTMHDETNSYPNEWTFRKIDKNYIFMDHTVAPYFSLEVILDEVGKNETKMTWNSIWENWEFLAQKRDFLIEKNNENFDRLEEELRNF